jgi:hypothetical protein
MKRAKDPDWGLGPWKFELWPDGSGLAAYSVEGLPALLVIEPDSLSRLVPR